MSHLRLGVVHEFEQHGQTDAAMTAFRTVHRDAVQVLLLNLAHSVGQKSMAMAAAQRGGHVEHDASVL